MRLQDFVVPGGALLRRIASGCNAELLSDGGGHSRTLSSSRCRRARAGRRWRIAFQVVVVPARAVCSSSGRRSVASSASRPAPRYPDARTSLRTGRTSVTGTGTGTGAGVGAGTFARDVSEDHAVLGRTTGTREEDGRFAAFRPGEGGPPTGRGVGSCAARRRSSSRHRREPSTSLRSLSWARCSRVSLGGAWEAWCQAHSKRSAALATSKRSIARCSSVSVPFSERRIIAISIALRTGRPVVRRRKSVCHAVPPLSRTRPFDKSRPQPPAQGRAPIRLYLPKVAHNSAAHKSASRRGLMLLGGGTAPARTGSSTSAATSTPKRQDHPRRRGEQRSASL